MEQSYWEARWQPTSDRPDDAREAYERDLARIIHSPAFRRLQGKTQVLGVGENDFYRTRLTHSVEVAQIAASLVRQHYRNASTPDELKRVLPSASHITAVALYHDVGHPPFGHGGELALNRLMHRYGGFEGNAQTLRICTKLGNTYQRDGGLNLSRRTLLGLLKYPASYNNVCDGDFLEKRAREGGDYATHESSYVDIAYRLWKPAKCFYESESDVVEWIFEGISSEEKRKFMKTVKGPDRAAAPSHRKTSHKSLDASVMDMADDISYGVHDLEDAIHLKLVDPADWEELVQSKLNDLSREERERYGLNDIADQLFVRDEKWKVKNAIGAMINYFIAKSHINEESFSDPLLKYNVRLGGAERGFLDAIQELVEEKVIKSATVQTLEFRGLQIVTRLFDALSRHPDRLLNKETRRTYERVEGEANKARVIADHVSGMTDEYATKLYERLFVPRHGSLFERV